MFYKKVSESLGSSKICKKYIGKTFVTVMSPFYSNYSNLINERQMYLTITQPF